MDDETEGVGKEATNDTDYESDEEALIHVSVSGTLQDDLRNLKSEDFSFLDVDSERPLVAIGNQVFEGEYVDCVGTSVFFTACERREPRDKVFDKYSSTVSVQLSDTTRKRLVLKRVFLNKKNQDSQTTESSSKEDSAQSETQGDKERIVESK